MINVFLSQGFCISIYLLVRVRLPVCLLRSLSVLDCALVFESHSGILCVLESNCAIDCFLLKFFVFLFKYLPGSTVQYIFFISIMNLCYIHFTKHTSIPTWGGGQDNYRFSYWILQKNEIHLRRLQSRISLFCNSNLRNASFAIRNIKPGLRVDFRSCSHLNLKEEEQQGRRGISWSTISSTGVSPAWPESGVDSCHLNAKRLSIYPIRAAKRKTKPSWSRKTYASKCRFLPVVNDWSGSWIVSCSFLF